MGEKEIDTLSCSIGDDLSQLPPSAQLQVEKNLIEYNSKSPEEKVALDAKAEAENQMKRLWADACFLRVEVFVRARV